MKRISFLFVAIGCTTVVEKPKPAADCYFCSEPIATHTTLGVSTSWSGVCERDDGFGAGFAMGPVTPRQMPCKEVAHDVKIVCANDACTWSPTSDGNYSVVPTRPGPLQVSVVLTPKHGKTRTIELPVVNVLEPTKAEASRCVLSADGTAELVVGVYADATRLVTDAKRVQLRGGDTCVGVSTSSGLDVQETAYRCKIASTDPVDLEVATDHATFATQVHCERPST